MRTKRPKIPRQRKMIHYWILVRTKTGQEGYAAKNIARQGLRVFNPKFRPAGFKWKLEVLFKSYLFVRIDRPSFSFLRNTFGVQSIHMRAGSVEKVPRRVIRELMAMQDEEGVIYLDGDQPQIKQKQPPPLKLGDRVLIEKGSFQKHLAVYDGISPDGRLSVLFEFMGKQVKLELERDDIKLIPEGEGRVAQSPRPAVATPNKARRKG